MCFYIRMKGTLQSVTLGGLEKKQYFPAEAQKQYHNAVRSAAAG